MGCIFLLFIDTTHEKLRMLNYQEDIPPWKKEVLMRRDGLSKAVENDTSLLNSEESVSNLTSPINGIKQNRYRIGSSSSFMSKVKSFFVDERHIIPPRNTRMSNGTKDSGKLFSFN